MLKKALWKGLYQEECLKEWTKKYYEKIFAYKSADNSVQNSAKKTGRSEKVLISCPGQLKKWHCLSLGANKQLEAREHQRVTLETSKH